MGRKKSPGDTLGLILATILAVILMLLLIAPVFLLVGWLYNILSFRAKSKGLKGTYSDFWLMQCR